VSLNGIQEYCKAVDGKVTGIISVEEMATALNEMFVLKSDWIPQGIVEEWIKYGQYNETMGEFMIRSEGWNWPSRRKNLIFVSEDVED